MLDPLTLDQMRVLVTVAETGSFSAAARRLGRVQSAISQSVQSLETVLGTPLFDRQGKIPKLNDAGRVILEDARRLIQGAETLKARAESIATEVEPELTLAVDSMFPNAVLMSSLKALSAVYPCLPVTVFTEGLGGAEQRLRDGSARLGIFVPFTGIAENREAELLVTIPAVAVVAANHPLAAEPEPVTRDMLENHVQLVLTDRTVVSSGINAGIFSPRQWRFVDLSTRLDFLVAGFGWCFMPVHLVGEHIAAGRLKVLKLKDNPGYNYPIHLVHERGRTPGKAGRWLIEDLRDRVTQCTAPLAEMVAAATGSPRALHDGDPPLVRSLRRNVPPGS
jgi:DNA-binding transcriptional LysR family regulator